MRGSIIKKAGRYYPVTRERGDDGRYRQRWHGGHRTKREAEAALNDVIQRLRRGQFVEPSKVTVRDYLEREWLPLAAQSVRPSTLDSYARNVRVHVVPHIGSVPLQQLTPGRLTALYTTLATEAHRHGGGLSAKSVRNVHVVLRKAFKDAVDQGLLVTNPAERAKPPRAEADRRAMRTWTAGELRAFLDHVRDDRLYAAWMLAASTGMRRGEVLGLRWSDVDADAARVAVRQSLVVVDYAVRVSEPKTAKGRRTIDLDPATVAALRQHRLRQAEERLAVGAAWHDSDLVFTTPDGRAVHPHAFSGAFDRHVMAAGLPRIRLHDLRHTHATLALRAGVPAKVVSERLGHATVAFTLDTYTHAVPGMQAEAARAVAALVWGD